MLFGAGQEERVRRAVTVLSGDAGVRPALAQLADAGGAAAAGDGRPAPAVLLLPQGGAAHRHALGAGEAREASSGAAGHRHLGRAGLLGAGLGRRGGGKDTMGGEVTQRLQIGIREGKKGWRITKWGKTDPEFSF